MTTTAQYGVAVYGDSQYGVITLDSASGSYTLTGVDAGGIYDQVMFCAKGVYTLTGGEALLDYDQRMYCGTGAYTLTGANAELIYTQPNQQVTTGGIGKKVKYSVKRSENDDIQSIVKKAFDKIEGIDGAIVESVKNEVEQDIQQIDLTNYDLALAQVRLMVLMAETRIKMLDEIRAEDEDEAALLMLI